MSNNDPRAHYNLEEPTCPIENSHPDNRKKKEVTCRSTKNTSTHFMIQSLRSHLLKLHDVDVTHAQKHGRVSHPFPSRLGAKQRGAAPGIHPSLDVHDSVVVELRRVDAHHAHEWFRSATDTNVNKEGRGGGGINALQVQ